MYNTIIFKELKEHRKMFMTLLLLVLCSISKGQDNTISRIKASFDKYHSSVYQEKVFIHTDKDAYLAGELLWLKSYNTDASTNIKSTISKVTYVELIDPAQKVVLQTKISTQDGSGSGSLFLPASLQSGNYILRGYTHWMMNFSSDFFFEKPLTIVNSFTPQDVEPVAASGYDIQFFPEGGNMVAGVENRIAFRLTDGLGSGLTFKGAVIDERNDTIARFLPFKFGIGSFEFTPIAGKTYRAVIEAAGSRKILRELPAVQRNTYSMLVKKLGASQLRVTVSTERSNAGPVYLFAHTRQQVSVTDRAVLNGGTASFVVDVSKMGEGISHLTIFDGNFNAVAERLYFKQPQRLLDIQVRADKGAYNSRDKVDININALVRDRPGATDLSMAVYKTDPSSPVSGDNIITYQWLSSELKGNIEHPEYYLQSKSEESEQALDNLLLTHGWRRFQWSDVMKGVEPTIRYIPEFEGHVIEGKITDKRNGRPEAGILTFLSVPSTRTQIYSSKSDQEGKIRFFTKDLLGAGEIVLQTNVMQDSTYLITIDSPFSEVASSTPPPSFKSARITDPILQDWHVSTQVQNVFAADKMRNFSSSVVDSAAFYGKPEFHYRLTDFVRFKTTEEVLREYVPSVVIFRRGTNFSIVVDKKTAKGPVGSVPLLILDGVPIFDRGNRILAFDPVKLRKLEVYTKNSYLGDASFNSIVNFTSVKGNLESFELDPRDLVLDYEGLQAKREFFSPVYETPAQQSARLPDFRQLLYWSPDIKTGVDGRKSVSFYTSDEAGKYTVILQGMSVDGNSGVGVTSFEVK